MRKEINSSNSRKKILTLKRNNISTWKTINRARVGGFDKNEESLYAFM